MTPLKGAFIDDLKEELMLNETVQPQPENRSNPETDLGALAEHLSVIADALRKTTNGAHDLENTASHALRPHINTQGTPQTASPSGGHSSAQGPAPSPFHPTDIKAKRIRYANLARDAYAIRRRRGTIFANDELFGEPAWDILLDLYIAHAESKPVSVSSACIGSAAPPTTGLRWLGVLSENELILRQHDPEDQRRVLVRLTEKGLTAMDEYFASTGMAA
ncbi:winged helix DNA-binding protein [Erythrobacter sp.]|uniref:winged helix DNA-binding protein n=2 Tax=Erythrobacter sp. TaxID=1042 RepID=UPI0032645CE7